MEQLRNMFEKETSLTIDNREVVSVNELNRVIAHLRQQNFSNNHCRIVFGKIKRIDIVFIAGLVLLHKNFSIDFDIDYTDKIIDDNGGERIFEVRQYLKHIESLYDISYGPIRFKRINKLYDESDNVASKSFVPILFIDAHTIDALFRPGSDERVEALRNKYERKLINEGTQEEKAYWERQSGFVNTELKRNSPVHTFVFSVLCNKVRPVRSGNEEEATEMVYRLWRFTEQYVLGLHELAKNIVEHSSRRCGMITIRAYDEFDEADPAFPNDPDTDSDRMIERVLETHVFDFGDRSILTKLMEDTRRKADESGDSQSFWREDFDLLSSDNYTLEHFVMPNYAMKLQQQLRRELAHYGIARLCRLITRNQGKLQIASRDGDGTRDDHYPRSFDPLKNKTLSIGTSYYFQLPFKPQLYEPLQYGSGKIADYHEGTETINTLTHIMKIRVLDLEESMPAGAVSENTLVNVRIGEMAVKNRDNEQAVIRIVEPAFDVPANYLAVNFDKINIFSSSLLRIVAALSQRCTKQGLIIYNVDYCVYEKMLQDNVAFFESQNKKDHDIDVCFWYEGKSVLVYSTLTGHDGPDFSFADILCGKDKMQYHGINRCVSHTFPNSDTIVNGSAPVDYLLPDCIRPFFFKKTFLYPFDLLLHRNRDHTIFQQNLRQLLQQDLTSALSKEKEQFVSNVDLLADHISRLEGYKLKETHFKLGSKVHTTDFYYAKKLFQNSYYTARIALILATKINNTLKTDRNRALTLVGYETYCELLISLVEKFLYEYQRQDIEHFVVLDDGEEIRCQPQGVELHNDVIIIVPIASTGSTARKIEHFIRARKGDDNLHFQPAYNVLLAMDEEFVEKHPEMEWNIPEDPLLRLPATWHSPEECTLCFDNSQSKPLFETDKTSLSPALIINPPANIKKLRAEENKSKPFEEVNFDGSILYCKVVRNGEHLLFSSKTDALIDNNTQDIQDWLDQIRPELGIPLSREKQGEKESEAELETRKARVLKKTDKVIILSPCHYSNTRFLHEINSYLFHSAATIIHYQPDTDYSDNFKLLYEKPLNQTDAKIFFVDDTLISGRTFFRIYDLFRFATGYRGKLSGAIFLSDKSAADIHTRVLRAAGRIDAFVNINLPLSPRVFNANPLEYEARRYLELYETALHDALKSELTEKANLLKRFGATVDMHDPRQKQHVRMFKATHLAYELFGKNPELNGIDTFDDFMRESGFACEDVECRIAMFKILSQYPFLLHMTVRFEVFRWHKTWIREISDELRGIIDRREALSYAKFEELKFLIRRSVFLSNFYILSAEFFRLLAEVFELLEQDMTSASGIVGQLSENERENVENFHLYMLAQYVEIIRKNRWCAVRLVRTLEETGVEQAFGTSAGKRMIRMLKIEIATVVDDFYHLLEKDRAWTDLYAKAKSIDDDKTNEQIKHYFEDNPSLLRTPEFVLANKALTLLDEKGEIGPRFLDYLWIKQFLNRSREDRAFSEISLTKKTEAIVERMCRLFGQNLGAFFIVTDKTQYRHLVFDRTPDQLSLIDADALNESMDEDSGKNGRAGSQHQYEILLNSLDGRPDATKFDKHVIVEYGYREEPGSDPTWKNLYEKTDSSHKSSDYLKYLKEKGYRWLLLERISDCKAAPGQVSLGLLGFYADKDLSKDLLSRQLSMLLRKDLSTFIRMHHKNDEFSALRAAEATRRFAYLAGHGRYMMQQLANADSDCRAMIMTMEQLQYLFAVRNVDERGNAQRSRRELRERIIAGFYANEIAIKDFAESLQKLANTIYNSPIVETRVQADIRSEGIGNSFSFSKRLLHFICFELIVNAKKNRYIYTEDWACKNGKNPKKNMLHIRLSMTDDDSALQVEFTGTGPYPGSSVIETINAGSNPKPQNEIAGLELIRQVIKILNQDNSLWISTRKGCVACESCKTECNCTTCSLSCDSDCSHKCEYRVYRNTIKLILHKIQK